MVVHQSLQQPSRFREAMGVGVEAEMDSAVFAPPMRSGIWLH
jgi:hypothetical protein